MRWIALIPLLTFTGVSQAVDIAATLAKAYPDYISGGTDNLLVWTDGKKMEIDDGLSKPFEKLLNQPDIEDQFTWDYPLGHDAYSPPKYQHDPGRVRYEPFFKKMYGHSAKAVKANLVKIKWMPKSTNRSVWVTRINGVDKKLAAVSRELDQLPPALKKYVTKTAGTFNWRTISGTKRLSTHAFGTAIDINIDYSHYWKWDKKSKGKLAYKNRIPKPIIEIFEKHGFIWGGKWYHYDTMHFEYRPELISPVK